MEPDAYTEMADTEDSHWWFRGRRVVTSRVIDTLALPGGAQILELGAGTGGNLKMLARYGSVQAGELDDVARTLSTRKTGIVSVKASLPDDLPFRPGGFDLVCLFDVLEHVQEDVRSLVAIRRLLKPSGRLLITVPAHQWMWSSHDDRLHHLRRYTRRTLAKAAIAAGYGISRLTYFNFLLFPAALVTRSLDRITRRGASMGTSVPVHWQNEALFRVFAMEASWVARRQVPLGMSLLAVLELT